MTSANDVLFLAADDIDEVFASIESPANEVSPVFSPDGDWVAYQSDEGGGEEQIYVVSFPGMTAKREVSTAGGTLPRWSRDGTEIFFLNGETVMVAKVSAGASFTPEPAEPIFTMPGLVRFDVAADGERILVRRLNPDSRVHEIQLVPNFQEVLRTRAGN